MAAARGRKRWSCDITADRTCEAGAAIAWIQRRRAAGGRRHATATTREAAKKRG